MFPPHLSRLEFFLQKYKCTCFFFSFFVFYLTKYNETFCSISTEVRCEATFEVGLPRRQERPTGLHQQPAGCKKQNRPRRLQKCHQSSLLGNKALVEIQRDISVGSPRRRIDPVGPILNRSNWVGPNFKQVRLGTSNVKQLQLGRW
jgi:hypothetical protein